MGNSDLMEKLFLGEVEGRYKAIQTYEAITWKVRAGYLALLFAGWSVLLKGVEGNNALALVVGMLIFSIALAYGAWATDRKYIRHKFSVIRALDKLVEAIGRSGGDYSKIPFDLLKDASESEDVPYGSKGYQESINSGNLIFFVPLGALAVATFLIFWKR